MQDVTMEDFLVVSGGALVLLVLVLLWIYRDVIQDALSPIVHDRVAEGRARRAWRQQVYLAVMSNNDPVPTTAPIPVPPHSAAVERPGTARREHVPDLREHLGTLSDDALVDIFATVVDASGKHRWAPSTIGRFVGGRLEDRIEQVRAARGGDHPPQPAARVIMMRDNGQPPRPVLVDPDYPYQPMVEDN